MAIYDSTFSPSPNAIADSPTIGLPDRWTAASGAWSVEGSTLKGQSNGSTPGLAVRLDDERPGRALPPAQWSRSNAQTVVVVTPYAGWTIQNPGWGVVACHSAPAGSPNLWTGYLSKVEPLSSPVGYNTHTMSIWKVTAGVPVRLGDPILWGVSSLSKYNIVFGVSSYLIEDVMCCSLTLTILDPYLPAVNLNKPVSYSIHTRPCENPTSQKLADIDLYDNGVAAILRHDFNSIPGRFRGVPGVAALPGTGGTVIDRVRLVQGQCLGLYGDREVGAALRPFGDGLTYDPGSGYYQPDSRLGGVLLPI